MDDPAEAKMYNWFIDFQMWTMLDFKRDDVALSILTSAIVALDLAGWC